MWWNADRAVFVHGWAPADIDHPSYLPIRLLRDAGFEVHVVALVQPHEAEFDGVRVWIERDSLAAVRRIVRLRAEFLFVEGTAFGTVCARAARRSWCRNPPFARRATLVRLQRVALRQFGAVTFTNAPAAQRWRLSAGQFTEFLYPVDLAFWRQHARRDEQFWLSRGLRVPDGPVLVYVANLKSGKRHVELIRDLAPLLHERRDMTLVFVGEETEPGVRQAIEDELRSADVDDQVVLTGFLGHWQVRELFAWTSMSVIHTAAETQCLAVYESLAAGVPALVTDIPSLTSQFPDLLVHRDGGELRANVVRLLENAALGAEQIVRAGARVALSDRPHHDDVFFRTVERLLGRVIR